MKGLTVTAIVALGLFAIALNVALIWWLIWSILDLVHGNPASFWNIAGIVIPAIGLLGSGGKAVAR
jgi:hypothetical protein